MSMTPAVAIHLSAALGALVLGPVALWARRGAQQRPRLHRAFGYAWVTLMVMTALSALFIHGARLPHIHGYSAIHLLVPLTLFGLVGAFRFLARGNIRAHRQIMTGLYFGACVGAGLFTLLPDRLLGRLLWGDWLGVSPGQIAASTPLWVWGLLAALVALGLSQARPRQVGLPRLLVLPLALGAFSLHGLVADFGGSPAVLGSWLVAALAMVLAVAPRPLPAGVAYDATMRRFALPGSWVPMLLILGIFLCKYTVGVSLAIQPALKAQAGYALAVALVSGIFSGLFAGRTLRLLRAALRRQPVAALAA